MKGTNITVNWKEKLAELKAWAKWKWNDAKIFYNAHKQEVIIWGPPIIGGVVEIVKICTKDKTVKEQKRLKENYIYDHKAGHYYELRRKLKNSEWAEIDRRRNYGEPLYAILEDMRVLK